MARPRVMRLRVDAGQEFGQQPIVAVLQPSAPNDLERQLRMLDAIGAHETGDQIRAGGDGREVGTDPARADPAIRIGRQDHARLGGIGRSQQVCRGVHGELPAHPTCAIAAGSSRSMIHKR